MHTVCHLLRERAGAAPDRGMLRFEGSVLSVGGLEEATNRLANVLVARGVRRGDRVAIMLPNGFDFPTAWLAVAKVGGVVVPVNTTYRERDLTHVLRHSRARFVVAGTDHLAILSATRRSCSDLEDVFTLGCAGEGAVGDLRDACETASPAFDIGHVAAADLVTIQYTSGTTGFPKGCMLTHGYWLSVGRAAQEFAALTAEDVVLTAQPFYYMDPTWNVVACLSSGAQLVVLPRFSASTFWQSVGDNLVTFFYCLGTMPMYLMKQPERAEVEQAHRVRLVYCSGIPVQRHAEFERRWRCPWREVYGTTELGAVLFVPPADGESVGSGAMGKPVAGLEARIVDEDGADVPAGELGELVVRGGTPMLGYYQDPEATTQWKRDGWAHTGDLCYCDGRGYYHLVGRIKDMIRRGGENISAVEVESVLCEHEAIRVAACIAVPDELRGEEVKALIQLQPGIDRREVSLLDIIDFAKERLAPFKVPRYVEYVEEFPMTPSERVAKAALRDRRAVVDAATYDTLTDRWGRRA